MAKKKILKAKLEDSVNLQDVDLKATKNKGKLEVKPKLDKMPKEIDPNNMLELWLKLIDAESEEEITTVQEAATKINATEIAKAVVTIRQMNEDEKMRELARLREDALHTEASAIGNATRKGERKGENKERCKIAKKLKSMGVEISQIVEGTGLTVEEIAKL